MEPAWVTRATRLPELSLARPSVQSVRILATSARGVQLDLKHHIHHLTLILLAQSSTRLYSMFNEKLPRKTILYYFPTCQLQA